jgi:hypothetical protein
MRCPPTIHRFSLQIFRRYEPIFRRVVFVHKDFINIKDPIIFKLSGSPKTHTARLNDAFNSLIENKWETDLDVKRLQEIWPSLTTRINNDQSCSIHAKRMHLSFHEAVRGELHTANPTELELRAMLVIQHFQTFANLSIEVTDLSPDLVQRMAQLQKEFSNTVIDYPDSNDPSHLVII